MLLTTLHSSSTDIPRGRERDSYDPLYQHHNYRNFLLQRHRDDHPILSSELRYANGKRGQSLLVLVSSFQRLIRDQQLAWPYLEEVIYVCALFFLIACEATYALAPSILDTIRTGRPF